MSSLVHGNNTLTVEITNISTHGIWLLTQNKEFFMAYEHFPWFEDQTVKNITNVLEQSPNHFYWPGLDVDLTLESIKHPERLPLKANT